VPTAILDLLAGLWSAGHAGYVVGGSLRDLLLGREPVDWDLATDATPERIAGLFPGALYENRFGTVAVPWPGGTCEITTFREDGTYSDARRPDDVRFTARIEDDLARRDFTINAIAWGVDPRPIGPDATDHRSDVTNHRSGAALAGGATAATVDPFDGRSDLHRGVLRAVGDPAARFHEDALRMLRAVRFAATLGFRVDGPTLAAIGDAAPLAARVSGERTWAELGKLLAAPRPSTGLRLAEETGLLAVIAPELARQRGVPQAKIPGDDLWDHTCRTVDATAAPPAAAAHLRLAALVHDIGKPATAADGHFVGHDVEGSRLALEWLETLRAPRAVAERVGHLVRHHMFDYSTGWTDAAIRRFLRRVGPDALDELVALRAADNVGSGLPAGAGRLDELLDRCHAQLAARVALSRHDLAVHGDDLVRALGIAPGPALGRLIDALLERVIADPLANERSRLIELARAIGAEDR
jgi:tRNA nucleotidyltransferase/poly(A) polymerase